MKKVAPAGNLFLCDLAPFGFGVCSPALGRRNPGNLTSPENRLRNGREPPFFIFFKIILLFISESAIFAPVMRQTANIFGDFSRRFDDRKNSDRIGRFTPPHHN